MELQLSRAGSILEKSYLALPEINAFYDLY